MSLIYEDGMNDIFKNTTFRPLAAETTNVNCLENYFIESDSVLIIYRGNGIKYSFVGPRKPNIRELEQQVLG
jgi:hypothetical protein